MSLHLSVFHICASADAKSFVVQVKGLNIYDRHSLLCNDLLLPSVIHVERYFCIKDLSSQIMNGSKGNKCHGYFSIFRLSKPWILLQFLITLIFPGL